MSLAPYLREIGRGKDGARALTRAQATDLMQQVLEGRVSDLQLGGFALAMRIKGESADELAGFLDAAQPLGLTLPLPGPAVLLPSYNGARKLPNLTPLLAGLLARRGAAVLVHGPLQDPGRVTSAEVWHALGWPIAQQASEAQSAWAQGQPVFMPIEQLHPPLARLLALRRPLGLRNSGHTMAKLLPVFDRRGAVRVVNHTHPEYAHSLGALLALARADALLMRGCEGEPVAHPRRRPRLAAHLLGELREDLSVPAQDGVLQTVPELPATIDPASTAAYTRRALDGADPVPEALAQQVDCLIRLMVSVQDGSVQDGSVKVGSEQGSTPDPA